jgi:hypothetical protein
MKITDSMPFAAELLTPTYEESFCRAGAAAGAGEVTVDQSWAIRVECDADLARVAADHLTHFVIQSVGGTLGSESAAHPIRLRIDPSLDANPETHRVCVSGDGIEVTGAGSAGVLQGVFRLENLMRERGGPIAPLGLETRRPQFRRRIHRSPLSPFYVDELTGFPGDPFNAEWLSPGMAYPAYQEEDAGPDLFYHDSLLMRLAQHGFNGIWLRAAFRHFAKVSVFPEFGQQAEEVLARLKDLCRRAARYGIDVFLYINEPMAIPETDEFFRNHPQCRGAASSYKPLVQLCTSTEEVRTYLRESTEYIFRHVPELAGMMMITASEFPSHCWCRSRVNPEKPQERTGEVATCPRCSQRTPQEVVGEIVRLVRDGAWAVKPEAEIIVWNWSWAMWEPDPQRGVLAALPEGVIAMGDFERGQPTQACGYAYTNDEYSIKVVGPSPRFQGVADFQRRRDLPVYAKIQIGTTHENPDIPYLPDLPKIAKKYVALRDTGVSGMMTCWNFGNMPSLGTETAGEFTWAPQPAEVADGLRRVALRNFGPKVADDVVAAWQKLSEAHEDFPSSIPVMYTGPVSRGPAFLLIFDQINRAFPHSWLLDKNIEGDLLNWVSPFTPEQVLECYRSEADKATEAIALLDAALEKVEGDDHRRLARETAVARFHVVQTLSAANVVDFLLTRNAFYAAEEAAKKRELLDKIEAICRAEAENAASALPLLDADSRLGWHGEAYGYMIDRRLVEEKLARLEQLLSERLPQERAALGA